MNLQFSQPSVVMVPSLSVRFATATGEATRAALNAFQETWRNHAPQGDPSRSFELMADIDQHTLKDIGAPNWLIAQAVERKDSHHLHLIELYRS